MSLWLGIVGAVGLWAWVAYERHQERKRFDSERRRFQQLFDQGYGCGFTD